MKAIATIALIALIIAAVAFIGPVGCTQPDDTRRVLAAQGYTQIEITGWRPWMASKGDTFSTGFKAKSPGGVIVTGAVTAGWLKGSTIRLD